MRVIKQPENIDGWKSTCACPRCEAELEYVIADISHVDGYYDPREPDSGLPTYRISCAVCKQFITVDTKGMTEYIKHVIYNNTYNNRFGLNER